MNMNRSITAAIFALCLMNSVSGHASDQPAAQITRETSDIAAELDKIEEQKRDLIWDFLAKVSAGRNWSVLEYGLKIREINFHAHAESAETLRQNLQEALEYGQRSGANPETFPTLYQGFSFAQEHGTKEYGLKLFSNFLERIDVAPNTINFGYCFNNFMTFLAQVGRGVMPNEAKMEAAITYAKECGYTPDLSVHFLPLFADLPYDKTVQHRLEATRALASQEGWTASDHAYFMALCARIPGDRLTGIFNAAGKILEAKKLTAANYGSLCYHLYAVPDDQLDKTIDTLIDLSQRQDWPSQQLVQMVQLASLDPKNRLMPIVELFRSLRDADALEEPVLNTISSLLQDFETRKLESLCKILSKFAVGKKMEAHEYSAFICGCHPLPSKRLNLAYDIAVRISADKNWNVTEFVDLLKSLTEVNPDRMDALLAVYGSLTSGKGWDAQAHRKIIRYMARINSDNWDLVLKTYADLVQDKKWEGKDHAYLIYALGFTPIDRFAAVIAKLNEVTAGKTWGAASYPLILTVLSKTQPERWDEMIELIEPLCSYSDESRPITLPTFESLLRNFPEAEIPDLIKGCVSGFQEDPTVLSRERIQDILVPFVMEYLSGIKNRENEDLQRLLNYWKEVLNGDNLTLSTSVCVMITDFGLNLGIDEEHELVQMAIKNLSQIQADNEDSPYVLFEKLKAKRAVTLQWDGLKELKETIGGLVVKLNPIRLAEFGISMVVDLTSVPKISSADFVELLNRLKYNLENNEELCNDAAHLMGQTKGEDGQDDREVFIEPEDIAVLLTDEEPDLVPIFEHTPPEQSDSIQEEDLFESDDNDPQQLLMEEAVMQLVESTSEDDNQPILQTPVMRLFKLIEKACKPDSHFCVLMKADPKIVQGSKLKCVINHFLNMPDGYTKWIRICQFLAGVRACEGGMNTAIQDYYMGLTPDFKIQTKSGCYDYDKNQMPAVLAILHGVQAVASMHFSPESIFMKQLCDASGEGQHIDQAAHVIIWLKSLIGNCVGLSEGPRFDVNAAMVPAKVQEKSLQEVMELYYKRLELKQLVTQWTTAFNRIMVADSAARQAKERKEDEGEEEVRSVYSGLQHIFEKYKVHHEEEKFFTWIDTQFADADDCFGQTVITERGMIRIMTHVGLLEEIMEK
jgi:hypothetical protein